MLLKRWTGNGEQGTKNEHGKREEEKQEQTKNE